MSDEEADTPHEKRTHEHEESEKKRAPALEEAEVSVGEGAPVKHVPTTEELKEKGWEGGVDVPVPKDKDPQKLVSPVLGTEYMEIDAKDLAVQKEDTRHKQGKE